MSLPVELQSPDFWAAYFFETEPDEIGDEDSSTIVEFAVGGGYALVLDIDVEISSVYLEMRTPADAETLVLGWDDQAHWHPDALRWAELDLIARAVAVADPGIPHPGPVVALAARFVVLGPDDDLDAITPVVDAAYGPRPAAATWWPRTRDWLHRADGRDHGVTWQRNEAGDWTVGQDEAASVDRDLYSLRRPGADFPFAAWRELLAAASATLAGAALPAPGNPVEQCWVDEVRTGAPPGSLIAARFGPSPLRGSRRYQLHLDVPRSDAAGLCVDLDRTLRDADRGGAGLIGTTNLGRDTPGLSFVVSIVDDLDAGVALTREVLRRHTTSPLSKLTHRRERLPLD